MDFKDTIQQIVEKIAKQKDSIATEEATKTSFVMPVIAALGYDVFNPFEVVPEMDCDLVKRKGEKIDYAIMKDENPILLIECKHCKQNLNLHDTQLQRYFVASKARFGVLTNGIEYRFYTDLEKVNIMDEKPFLVVNMLDLSDNDIEQLKKFHKSYYNEQDILSTAQELQITIQVKEMLNRNFQMPDDEFTRYFVRNLNDGFYSAYIADEFIDSGDYTQSKNIVSCQNSYFNRTTIYTVEEVSDDLLKVNIDYKDLYGNKKTKSISFTKVKKTPSTKNNTLSGKSYTFNAPYFGNITMSFNTYNSGIKSATKGSAKQYPLNFFYIYIGEKVYYQILENATIQVPSIGAWTNYNDVICWTIDIGTNGEIIHIDTIPL